MWLAANIKKLLSLDFSRLNLRWKTLIVVVPTSFITITLFTFLLISISKHYFIDTTEHFLSALGNQLSFSIGRSYKLEDSRSLYRFIKEYIAYDNWIQSITIVNKAGEITADSDPTKVFNPNQDPDVKRVLTDSNVILVRSSTGEKTFYKLIIPIFVWETQKIQGALKIQYDASNTFALIRQIQFWGWILSAIFSIVMAYLLVYFLNRKVTHPISALMGFITQFDFYKQVNYSMFSSSKDEIGRLEDKFYQLLKNLQDTHSKLVERNVEITTAYLKLRDTQVQLIQSEKMATLGLLTAGIAHEVNNPMNFVYGNLSLIDQHLNEMKRLLKAYEHLEKELPAEKSDEIQNIKREIDFETVFSDLKVIINDCKTGARRTLEIVKDLRNFSRTDSGDIQQVNLNDSLRATLKLLYPQYKRRIRIETEWGQLPGYSCYAGQLNQVFMNIIMNAIQAIPDAGKIFIRTNADDSNITIEICDDGAGIPEEIRDKIFDPFFTTKSPGQGTGLGLSIALKTVQKHGGQIRLDSELGKGTSFKIELPIEGVGHNGD